MYSFVEILQLQNVWGSAKFWKGFALIKVIVGVYVFT